MLDRSFSSLALSSAERALAPPDIVCEVVVVAQDEQDPPAMEALRAGDGFLADFLGDAGVFFFIASRPCLARRNAKGTARPLTF